MYVNCLPAAMMRVLSTVCCAVGYFVCGLCVFQVELYTDSWLNCDSCVLQGEVGQVL